MEKTQQSFPKNHCYESLFSNDSERRSQQSAERSIAIAAASSPPTLRSRQARKPNRAASARRALVAEGDATHACSDD